MSVYSILQSILSTKSTTESTVNTRVVDTPVLISGQNYKEMCGNNSRYYGITDTSCGPKLTVLFCFCCIFLAFCFCFVLSL